MVRISCNDYIECFNIKPFICDRSIGITEILKGIDVPSSSHYYATYARFSTKDKSSGSFLTNADNIIGDTYSIEFRKSDNDKHPDEIAWLVNRFGKDVGYFDVDISRQLQVCNVQHWKIYAILASVWFTENPKPGTFWGEMVIMSYAPDIASDLDIFRKHISKMLADGIRPNVLLDSESMRKVIETHGNWQPNDRVESIPKTKGSVLLKDRATLNDKIIDQGRVHRVGCTILGWAVVLLLIAIVVLIVRSCS